MKREIPEKKVEVEAEVKVKAEGKVELKLQVPLKKTFINLLILSPNSLVPSQKHNIINNGWFLWETHIHRN